MQVLTLDKFHPHCKVMPPTKALRPLRLQLLEEVEVWDNYSEELIIILPKGFISDGASVPNFFHRLFPPFGIYLGAAFVHDRHCDIANETGEYKYREQGDKNFEDWLRQCGVRSLRAKPMAASVKSYGKYLKLTGELK